MKRVLIECSPEMIGQATLAWEHAAMQWQIAEARGMDGRIIWTVKQKPSVVHMPVAFEELRTFTSDVGAKLFVRDKMMKAAVDAVLSVVAERQREDAECEDIAPIA